MEIITTGNHLMVSRLKGPLIDRGGRPYASTRGEGARRIIEAELMIPGEIIVGEGELILSEGLATRTIRVANVGDRPVQVGSHFHFFEVNSALEFDREAALGFRLDVPSGSAVRFEPGDEREVNLVALAGEREVHGLNTMVNGKLGAMS